MARANAAGGTAHAGTLGGLARALTQPGHLRMAAYEPWLRRLVPLLVAVFMTILAVGAVFQCREARDRAVSDAVSDLDMVGALAADQLNAALARQPGEITGSRLWLLSREKQLSSVLNRARAYAAEALKWLVDAKIAAVVRVNATNPRDGVLALSVEIDRPAGPGREVYDFLWEATS